MQALAHVLNDSADSLRSGDAAQRWDCRGARTPSARPIWVTCQDNGLDHLVNDDDMGRAISSDQALGFHALCGRSVVPAPMICPPFPQCRGCLTRRDCEQRSWRRLQMTSAAHGAARHRAPGIMRRISESIHCHLAGSSLVGRHAADSERNSQVLRAGSECGFLRPRRVPASASPKIECLIEKQAEFDGHATSVIRNGSVADPREFRGNGHDHRWQRTAWCAGVVPVARGESRVDRLPGKSAPCHRAFLRAQTSARHEFSQFAVSSRPQGAARSAVSPTVRPPHSMEEV
ncbi:hypothetical protein [Amycolatopsis rubida]|uniref:Uncharacterized protein n=1 Tax=Amycolatopsis rubida TaxID=112413 RepID=A0A1I5KT40_9PSEU|nr:hypothetical protein [Amycolatopsis rubida]SFO88147.1 hypothetical protein SAMN05421854_103326 [Amycolatopsis rubida]